MIRVLVTGGRTYSDANRVYEVLDTIHAELGITVLIHGAANGADALARAWAESHDIPWIGCHADWRTHGKSAGPIRNAGMLADHKPDLVVAFKGNRGTADMVRQARAAGVEVREIPEA